MPIVKIERNFRATANFSIDGEVELFRKLAKAIVKCSQSVFVEETHGATKYNVSFNLTTGTTTRCEIADLLIISKSKRHPFLRATFWQAKKQKNPNWVSLATTDRHIDFSGQFNQWDLLSRRPSINGISSFQPPSNLLSSFDSGSIGSFGIFYERDLKIELMHSTAEFIVCGKPKAKNPKMVTNAFLERYFYMGGEIIVRSALRPFLKALFDHQIGARLSPTDSAHQWLVAYAAKKVMDSGQDIPSNFFAEFDNPRALDASGGDDGVSVLLVHWGDAE
ncbi:hypothetical protein ACXHWJ_16830 [Alcaligenes nematophilus]